jgi:DNA-binding CsgD family transcriptional regulator
MADEITLAVMRRDGLSPETVWAHVEQARASLRDRMVPMLRQCA